MQFNAIFQNNTVTMDASKQDGGNNLGASPKKLMLASLAGCTGMDVVSILNKMKVKYENFSIDVEATLSQTHSQIYNKVSIHYKISIAETDKIKMEKTVKLSQDKYCGLSAMFKAFASLSTQIEYL